HGPNLNVHRHRHRYRRDRQPDADRAGPVASAGHPPPPRPAPHPRRAPASSNRATIADGASIACNGVCLTVVASGVDRGKTWFDVDAAAETLSMTTAKHWAVGSRLNLERALKIGDELGGHIVAGHANGIATIRSRE